MKDFSDGISNSLFIIKKFNPKIKNNIIYLLIIFITWYILLLDKYKINFWKIKINKMIGHNMGGMHGPGMAPGMGMQPGMGHHPGMGMQPGMGMGHHPGMGMQPGMGMGHHPGMGMGPHY